MDEVTVQVWNESGCKVSASKQMKFRRKSLRMTTSLPFCCCSQLRRAESRVEYFLVRFESTPPVTETAKKLSTGA